MKQPPKEAFKEIMRWTVFVIVSGLLTVLPFFPTHLIPETVMVLNTSIPLQMIVVVYVIPAVLRFVDKYRHENMKAHYETRGESMGILPF